MQIRNVGNTLLDFSEGFASNAAQIENVYRSIQWAKKYDVVAVAIIEGVAADIQKKLTAASEQCTALKDLYEQHEATLPTEGKLYTTMNGFAHRLREVGETLNEKPGKVIENIEPYRPVLRGVSLDNEGVFRDLAGSPESVQALLGPYRAVLAPKVQLMGEFVSLKRLLVGTARNHITDYHAAETFEAVVGKVGTTQTRCNALYSSFERMGKYLFPLTTLRGTDDSPPRP